MNRSVTLAAVLTAAMTTGSVLLTAQDPLLPQAATSVVAAENASGLYFVELVGAPTADGGSLATVRAEKAAFRRAATAAGVQFRERYAYDVLFNGLAIRVSPGQLGVLSRISGVRNVYPVVNVEAPRPEPREGEVADMASALGMTGADVAQSELGLSGQGIRVAVMDTGVDYDHPDLGGCFGQGCRVVVGHDFVGDAYDSSSPDPAQQTPAPDADPDDCGGHGTHVAGIIGANGTVKGVAPEVTLGAYKVFGCTGSTSADVMMAAMERALADDMQVLNMSIGAAFQWPQYPTAVAASRLVNRGVTVVASIGNSGANGVYAAGAPGVGAKVIGVASFDNARSSHLSFAVSPDGRLVGYTQASAAPTAPTSGSLQLARTGTTTTANDACSALPAGSLTGRVALIRRGTCSFHTKASNAQAAGAAGVVLYNNAAGSLTPTVAGVPAVTIPVVMISQADGALVDGRIASVETTLTWTDQVVTLAVPTAGLISSFSSYGLPPDLSVKPDLGAPGGLIRSTYPVELGSYANLSGTSMASPHVAGAVALLLEARPRIPAQAVAAILQNTAEPRRWSGNPGLGFLDHVHRQGAGMLRIDRAIETTTRVEPSRLALGESEAGPATRTLTIRNGAGAPVTYTLSHQPALATGGTFAIAVYNAPSAVSFAVDGLPATSVTVPAGSTQQVSVTIAPSAGLALRTLYGGYLRITPPSGDPIVVPFAGLKGDYQSIQVLTPTANGFPWLARQDPATGLFGREAAGAVYSMVNADVPAVLAHFDHPSRHLRMEVFDAATGKAWHRASQEDFLPRNPTATGAFAFWFDGTTRTGNRTTVVPDGSYYLRVSVLKALGDEGNPAHWETWTSPMFVIARPGAGS